MGLFGPRRQPPRARSVSPFTSHRIAQDNQVVPQPYCSVERDDGGAFHSYHYGFATQSQCYDPLANGTSSYLYEAPAPSDPQLPAPLYPVPNPSAAPVADQHRSCPTQYGGNSYLGPSAPTASPCRPPNSKTRSPNMLRRFVNRLRRRKGGSRRLKNCMQCPCGAVFPAASSELHIVQCPLRKVMCPSGCGEQLPRHVFTDGSHYSSCAKRKLTCSNCNEQYAADDLFHDARCPQAQVTCEGCRQKISRADIISHYSNCKGAMVTCEHCQQLVARADLTNHLECVCEVYRAPCLECGVLLTVAERCIHVCPDPTRREMTGPRHSPNPE
eukprot:NODE_2182_length_1181_cov_4.845406_g1808_i0.p1 GENE.NODE_2182_length_1181_cov_4.845406_g1808_i0~~NODE_2182_length_1181_cov_4.845406_g1808_i0.p1  ORF type:complete len:328 (+),score=14.13 NODE_2182_length_1181_cov_4.845406_g1808_i0:143-1126(+)